MHFTYIFAAIALLLILAGGAFHFFAWREIKQSVRGAGVHDAAFYRAVGWALEMSGASLLAAIALLRYYP